MPICETQKNLIDVIKNSRGNDGPPFLVINQLGMPKRPEISVSDFSKALEMEPVAVFEYDAQLFGTASNNGQMIEEVSPKSKAAEGFRELSFTLTNKTDQKAKGSSLLRPILDRLNIKKAG